MSRGVRKISVVTVARSDYGIYAPLLRRIESRDEFELTLLVTGMHLSPEFGLTVQDIEEDGYAVSARVESTLSSDTPQAIAKSAGLTTLGFADAFQTEDPDLLFVLGDRYEMLGAATAAVPYNIPIAHLHGGESTLGLIDEQIRHALTKLSHLHFASTDLYAERIRRMGEEGWRVHAPGALSLDNLRDLELRSPDEIEDRYGIDLTEPTLLITYHPVTLEYARTEEEASALFRALQRRSEQMLFTYPNADTAGRQIIERLENFVEDHDRAVAVKHLGQRDYFSVMSHVCAMVGNSSSGIIESGSFGVPVVDVGDRQGGRVRGPNVIDVPPDADRIAEGIEKAVSTEFRGSLEGMDNPYGDGHAADRILEVVSGLEPDSRLLFKRFED